MLSIFATLANVSCDKSTQNGLCQTEVRRSEGRVVHAMECEVPAEIWWTGTPSSKLIFWGVTIGECEWPSPHWPIVLMPQAKTEQSWACNKKIKRFCLLKWSLFVLNILIIFTIFIEIPESLEKSEFLYIFFLSKNKSSFHFLYKFVK